MRSFMKKLYYDVKKCLGCKSCELACSLAHSLTQDIFKAIKEEKKSLPRKKVHSSKGNNYPVSCRHCKEPKCVDACMAAALYRDDQKDMVVYDQERCVGCWMCVMSCPYGAIRPNILTKLAIRCDKCQDKDEPACVKACPTGAIIWCEEAEVKV
ncbi:MAG: 4Fe-4S dicluster domain-containing protein [Candidatus Omnitrophica bacterium]|nr:4Fe-4S dicluster domain-containing protein [Candidatus Omnitrophota bacterium]